VLSQRRIVFTLTAGSRLRAPLSRDTTVKARPSSNIDVASFCDFEIHHLASFFLISI
jgi:hypothetical protein